MVNFQTLFLLHTPDKYAVGLDKQVIQLFALWQASSDLQLFYKGLIGLRLGFPYTFHHIPNRCVGKTDGCPLF